MTALRLAFDRSPSVRSYDSEGRLHIQTSNICTAGVSDYRGDEIPGALMLGLDLNRRYKVVRPAEELAKPETIRSANGLPILSVHEPVDARSHRPDLTIGATGNDAVWRPPFIQNSLVFWPVDSIRLIEDEVCRELSPGYSSSSVKKPVLG